MEQELRARNLGEASSGRRIDAVCDRFEVAWRAGESPRIEKYLADWAEPERTELLLELLGVELELRLEAGEDPTLQDYLVRFPELGTINGAVLSGFTDNQPGLASIIDRMPCDPFPFTGDGPLGPINLAQISTWEETLEPTGHFQVPTPHATGTPAFGPTGSTTELLPRTPDSRILTATDLMKALADLTEQISGDSRKPSDDGTTTLLGLEATLQSEAPEPIASTDQTSVDPALKELESTIGLHGLPVSPPQDGTGTATTTMIIPGYELLEKLGEGGMGVVYKARQLALNRLVAVKMIRGEGTARPDQIGRLHTEAESIARLRHPHILQIHNTGVVGDCPFLALELLDGGSLADRLAHTPQPGRSSAELMVTLARAIHDAHLAGIVHRDLKPSNVLFSSKGIPKISDFGLAKLSEAQSTQTITGLIMGSPSYMAPEQARGHSKNVGPAADVYSLGAIFYEMLTGRPPFKGETPIETVRQVTDDDPVPPSRLVPRLERDLETICLKCLSKEVHQRYDSASDLADDLERYLRGESIKARSTGFLERGVKWSRRRPALATLVALGLAATVALTLTSSWLVRKEGLRIDRLRREVLPSLLIGQALLAKEKWSDATEHLTTAHVRTHNEPRLVDLDRQAEALLKQAERVRADQEAREADQEAREADQERYREFVRLRDEALIHDTQFTGLDTISDPKETCRATLAALAVFAARDSADSWASTALPPSLSQSQQDEIRDGCYALLLVLSDAVERPDQGLRILDEATRLHPPTRAYHLRRSACLGRAGDSEGAQRERMAAERVPITTPFDHLIAGQERYRRRDWLGAKQQFDAVLQVKPDDFWAHCLSAISGLNLHQPLPAKAELIACLQIKPDLPWLYMLRGLASQQAAVLTRSTAEISVASEVTSRVETQILLNDAAADFNKALELLVRHPNEELRYQTLINRGLLWLLCHDWDKAEADLQSAIVLKGKQYLAYEALAQVRWRQDRLDEAIEQFSHAIALRPNWAPLYRARADVELSRKDPSAVRQAKALDDVEQAIRLSAPDDPVRARDYTTRARLLHLARQDKEALAACETALKVVPNYADAHRLRLDLLLAMSKFEEVISSCDALLTQGKASVALYELRALARAGQGDYAGAIADNTEALTLSPNSVRLLGRRGWLYLVTGAAQLASSDFNVAIRLQSSADAHLGRGTARVQLGQYRAGIDDVERALSLANPTQQTLYRAARVLARAAVAANSDVRKNGREAVVLSNDYQDRAVKRIQEALKLLPADRRAAFVAEVLDEPDLSIIRPRLRRLLPVYSSGSQPKS